MLLILVTIVICLLFTWALRNAEHKPRIYGWWFPFIGAGLQYLRDPAKVVRSARKYARNQDFILRLGPRDIWVLNEPVDIQKFYKSPATEVSLWEAVKITAGVGEVLDFGLTGPEEDNQGIKMVRKHVTGRVAPSTAGVSEEIANQIERMESSGGGNPINLSVLARNCVTAAGGYVLYGLPYCRNEKIIESATFFDAYFCEAVKKGFFNAEAELKACRSYKADIMAELERMVDERLRYGEHGGDLAGALIEAGYKADLIARELFNYLFASITNTYTAAHLTLMRIITDEPLLARVRDEIDAVLGAGRKGKLVLDSATMAQFKLLDAVGKEVLRMYPSMIHTRLLLVDIELPSSGKRIPKGTTVAVSPYLVHRNNEVYKNPAKFDPDRWLTGEPVANIDFLPFGRGFHKCLGMALAEAEVKQFVIHILHSYDVTLVNHLGEQVEQGFDWFQEGAIERSTPGLAQMRVLTMGKLVPRK